MRIVRFSSPNSQILPFEDQKVSLRKLSQVKALSSVQYYQQKPTINQSSNLTERRQSHIKWVPDSEPSKNILNDMNHTNSPQEPKELSKRVPRRKIFQSKDHSSKQNVQIPTFTKMPSMKSVTDQQHTQYYSMINSPKELNRMMTSKVSESQQPHLSPFSTNEQNSRFEYNHTQMLSSNIYSNSIEKSSITELADYHIPKLQQRLKQHDEELSTIKKYLKNTEQLNTLKQSIKQYQEIQALKQKQIKIQAKREYLMNKIQQARNKEAEMRRKYDQEANQTIKHIEEQRLKRLQKIQRENQRLYQNLKNNYSQQFETHENAHDDYHFQGPIAFPSKDWESESEIMMPQSEGFHKNYNSRENVSFQKGSNTGELSMSPIIKRRMNQISQIGFSNNKTESFSMQANTFRDFTSPLDFQGQNDTW